MELLCGENYFIKRAFEDPVLIKDQNVLETLFVTEEKDMGSLPDTGFFDKIAKTGVPSEIKPFMRKIVGNWMLEVLKYNK